jgi:serine/threonine protein kinase
MLMFHHTLNFGCTGCLLYEIASLRRPFEASNIKELANKVLMNRFQDIPPTFSREMRVLVRKLLVLDPFQRPSVTDLLRQPYITSRFSLLPPELREDSYLKGESCGKMRATIKFSRHLTKAMLPVCHSISFAIRLFAWKHLCFWY